MRRLCKQKGKNSGDRALTVKQGLCRVSFCSGLQGFPSPSGHWSRSYWWRIYSACRNASCLLLRIGFDTNIPFYNLSVSDPWLSQGHFVPGRSHIIQNQDRRFHTKERNVQVMLFDNFIIIVPNCPDSSLGTYNKSYFLNQ